MAVIAIAEETTTGTVAIDAGTFRRMAKNAAAFSSKDAFRPVLNTTLCQYIAEPTARGAGTFRMVSTDSYRVIIQDAECDGSAGSWLVTRASLERFVKVLPARPVGLAAIRFGTDRATLTAAGTEVLSDPFLSENFPNVLGLADWFASIDMAAENGGSAAFNPAFLSDIGKLLPLNGDKAAAHVRIETNGLRPMRFAVGSPVDGAFIVGGLMPVRTAV